MPVTPRRIVQCALGLALVGIAVLGVSSNAEAQVYKGTLQFNSSPFVFNITVTIQPAAAALYQVTFLNRHIDSGFLAASVNGSSVVGYIQSSDVTIAQCKFAGNYDGTTAILQLDPGSCGGGGGLIVLTRA